MKILCILGMLCMISITCVAQRGSIDPVSNEFSFSGTLGDQYEIYGYSKPSRKSEKLILFSVYPSSVADNPRNLLLGAYHETANLPSGHRISFVGEKNGYAEMNYTDDHNKVTTFYLSKRYVDLPKK